MSSPHSMNTGSPDGHGRLHPRHRVTGSTRPGGVTAPRATEPSTPPPPPARPDPTASSSPNEDGPAHTTDHIGLEHLAVRRQHGAPPTLAPAPRPPAARTRPAGHRPKRTRPDRRRPPAHRTQARRAPGRASPAPAPARRDRAAGPSSSSPGTPCSASARATSETEAGVTEAHLPGHPQQRPPTRRLQRTPEIPGQQRHLDVARLSIPQPEDPCVPLRPGTLVSDRRPGLEHPHRPAPPRQRPGRRQPEQPAARPPRIDGRTPPRRS